MSFLSSLFGGGKATKTVVRPPVAKKGQPSKDVRRVSLASEVAAPVAEAADGTDGAVGVVGGAPEVISSYDKVPQHSSVLTVGHDAPFKLPHEMRKQLAVLDRGGGRVVILYDVSGDSQGVKKSLSTLRHKIRAQNLRIDAEHVARPVVMEKIYQEAVKRAGGDGPVDRNEEMSAAKQNFYRWAELAVAERATDIHMEIIGPTQAQVLFRVDGELTPAPDGSRGIYPPSAVKDAMSYAFNLAANNGTNSSSMFDESKQLYCMIAARKYGDEQKEITMRFQSSRGHRGPKAVCRLLCTDMNAPTLTFQELGYENSQEGLFTEGAKMTAGFVLLAGVTGSGKTTSLKTFVETHPGNGTSAFYSIEDPVEYPLKGVHQIPMQRDLNDKQASIAKFNEVAGALVRMDPDGVIVGEIRDFATAAAGQQMVETGHMAAGTVHAHLLSGIIPRVTNQEIGMSREVLTNPNMLSLLVYQALVPKLCPSCRLTPKAAIEFAVKTGNLKEAEHIKSILKSVQGRFRHDGDYLRWRNPEGCAKCRQRGTYGLSVVAEMLIPDKEWLRLIREGKDAEAVSYYRSFSDGQFNSSNMNGKTVFEHTLYKALNQMVDPRQCERFDLFDRFEVLERRR